MKILFDVMATTLGVAAAAAVAVGTVTVTGARVIVGIAAGTVTVTGARVVRIVSRPRDASVVSTRATTV